MRKPLPDEFVVCPNSRSKTQKKPAGVFDTVNPKGEKVSYGVIAKHQHGMLAKECEWTDLVAEVVHYTGYTI